MMQRKNSGLAKDNGVEWAFLAKGELHLIERMYNNGTSLGVLREALDHCFIVLKEDKFSW
jgi:hypothetical protein